MSENNSLNPKTEDVAEPLATTPESPEPLAPANPTPEEGMPDPENAESTVGTGTSMALGCIAGTVVLIVVGLLFLFLSTLF